MLGKPFRRALRWALELHGADTRKGTDGVPYVAHLLSVAALVLEDGGQEPAAIAALLHDAMEDHGVSFRKIQRRVGKPYGRRVAEIVLACSDGVDADGNPTVKRDETSWRSRKECYLVHLNETEDPEVLQVSAADKLHNARAILADLRAVGSQVWERFNASPADELWYYETLKAIFERSAPNAYLTRELAAAVDQISQFTPPSGQN
jgi:(p)ppGpp synthase/HD superfamily hydrolase